MKAQEGIVFRESAGTAGIRRSAETEKAERIVRALIVGTVLRESAGTTGIKRSAETEETEAIVRALTVGTVPRVTVRATTGETARVITGTAATVRALTGITMAATVQTIIEGIVLREAVRMEDRATVRAALTAVGAETVHREDVRTAAADRAERIRWDVR